MVWWWMRVCACVYVFVYLGTCAYRLKTSACVIMRAYEWLCVRLCVEQAYLLRTAEGCRLYASSSKSSCVAAEEVSQRLLPNVALMDAMMCVCMWCVCACVYEFVTAEGGTPGGHIVFVRVYGGCYLVRAKASAVPICVVWPPSPCPWLLASRPTVHAQM